MQTSPRCALPAASTVSKSSFRGVVDGGSGPASALSKWAHSGTSALRRVDPAGKMGRPSGDQTLQSEVAIRSYGFKTALHPVLATPPHRRALTQAAGFSLQISEQSSYRRPCAENGPVASSFVMETTRWRGWPALIHLTLLLDPPQQAPW